MRKYSQQYNKSFTTLSNETMTRFMNYDWPGNVRELENMIKRVVVLGNENAVLTRFAFKGTDIQGDIQYNINEKPKVKAADSGRVIPPDNGFSLRSISKKAIAEVERETIKDILLKTRWNRREASRLLKVSYKALLNKIKEYELDKRL